MRTHRLLSAAPRLAAALVTCGAGALSACRPAATTSSAAPSAAKAPESDVCQGSPPVPHLLTGVLRNARCDQDMYWSMSQVADQLGVNCIHCHAHTTSEVKSAVFPTPTPQKEIANWMSVHLMQSVKPVDGSPIKCASCHTDEHGQPVAKILGAPRDKTKANEWMSLVMVKKFVAADGSRLRCKTCHTGIPGTPEFKPQVILQTAQLPRHAAGEKGSIAW